MSRKQENKQKWLLHNTNTLLLLQRGVLFQGNTFVPDDQKQAAFDALRLLNEFLLSNKWVAGINLTIADLHFAATIATFVVI